MTTNAKVAMVTLCTFIAMAMAVPTLLAAPLGPGMLLPAPAEPDPGIGAPTLISGAVPFAAGTIAGTLTSSVISGDVTNPFGGLTFTYQLTNLGPDTINRLTLSSFAGFLTDVSFRPSPAQGAFPLLMDRSVSGSVVGFTFTGSPATLTTGATSELLVVQTNAPTYTIGSASVIDGSAVGGVFTYAPVPEPVTLAVLAVGIAGALFRRRQA